MISIVGFGRPKFKAAGAAPTTKTKAEKTSNTKCPTCGK